MNRTLTALTTLAVGVACLGTAGCAPAGTGAEEPSSTQSPAGFITPTVSETSTATSSDSPSTTPEASSSDTPPADDPYPASPSPSGDGSSPAATPTASGQASAASVEPVTVGAEITAISQIPQKLGSTSKEFQAFITKVAKDSAKTAGGGSCPNFTIEVDQYWPSNDQATGGITACGGARTIWFTDARGTWKEFGYQSVPYCSVVRGAGVPHAIDLSTGFGCIEKGSIDIVAYEPTR